MSDPHPSALSGVFGRPFTEQVAFFRRKLGNLVPTRRWDDMVGAQHDHAFMVAGAAKADLLTDLAAAVDKAITEGRGLEEFRKDFRAIVKRNGWTGWTGEGSVRGEAWRVGVIYRTNAYTSYSAGRLAQLRQGNYPFWVYRHGGSLEPRPHHLSWDGLVLEPDHPFWKTHYPPSDWGCSCYALGARSKAAARRLGGDPEKKLPGNWNVRDRKTGAPAGIGRGWDYAPGDSVADQVNAIAGKVRRWDYAIARAFMDELPPERADALSNAYRRLPSTADDARRYAAAIAEGREPAGGNPVRTMGMVRSDQAQQLEQLAGRPIAGFDYRFTPDSVRHILDEHGGTSEVPRGQRPVTPEDFAELPGIVSRPDRILGPDRSNINELLVHYEKRIRGELYRATFAVATRRRSLTLKTMFVRVGQ